MYVLCLQQLANASLLLTATCQPSKPAVVLTVAGVAPPIMSWGYLCICGPLKCHETTYPKFDTLHGGRCCENPEVRSLVQGNRCARPWKVGFCHCRAELNKPTWLRKPCLHPVLLQPLLAALADAHRQTRGRCALVISAVFATGFQQSWGRSTHCTLSRSLRATFSTLFGHGRHFLLRCSSCSRHSRRWRYQHHRRLLLNLAFCEANGQLGLGSDAARLGQATFGRPPFGNYL